MTRGLEGLQIDEDSSDSEGCLKIMPQPTFGDAESEDSPEPPALVQPLQPYQGPMPSQVPSILLHIVQDEHTPTLEEAESAISVLRAFVQAQHPDFVTDTERDTLLHISSRLVRAGAQLPYDPPY